MLTNRIVSFEKATIPNSPVEQSAILGAVPNQLLAQGPLALQIIAMQQAYEQALRTAREEARQLFRSQLQPSLN